MVRPLSCPTKFAVEADSNAHSESTSTTLGQMKKSNVWVHLYRYMTSITVPQTKKCYFFSPDDS